MNKIKKQKKKSRFPQWLGSVAIIQRRDYYHHYSVIIFLLLVGGGGGILTVCIVFFVDELIKGSLQNFCFCI